ncbi:oxygen-dependent tRNA uridine(34) hydroxylase TrhO [Aurantiacibacter sp. D1-12]|uniref:oxygen-dependent tRNA uridine(34) hydroxylase TrhO n=1 Tax=Aurantiacibacter sp. D1-12 TaxID=2993658 RepID=UPI00237CB1B0|nr:rhodanese-related sulfurtransferase [Aurantiacibacter sp. D1-12]MDE1467941.1 rhodanese-related sulfurtransferase [Aurantiacibacter sp. D1-12]
MPIDPSVPNAPIRVAALYQFTRFDDHEALQAPLQALFDEQGIRGIMLLAAEGINGTIAGTPEAIDAALEHIRGLPGCADIAVKFSGAQKMPFLRMKVRLKNEIVTMGQPDIDPARHAGTYVDPADWNDLIADPDTIVIDTRNDYEVAIGQFDGAIDPKTPSFRDFPEWFRAERERLLGEGKQPKVAMYCTGGIRCEKSTAFLAKEGVDEVYHLKGGILKYLEEIPEELSMWRGECFVFDQRVSVGHGLKQGPYSLCRACRRPLSEEDKASEYYEEGVSCAACITEKTEQQRASYRERQKQEKLAASRGEAHLGKKLATSAGPDGFDDE